MHSNLSQPNQSPLLVCADDAARAPRTDTTATMDVHPLLTTARYPIYTRPIERLLNGIRLNIKADHHGVDIFGRGRDGKTLAMAYLCQHLEWLQGQAAVARVVVAKGTLATDRAFYAKLCAGMGIRSRVQASADDRREVFINALLDRCGPLNARMIVLFLDEAQRLQRAEMDYLVDIDNALDEENVRLFIVFVRQSDERGAGLRQRDPEFPSHIKGRFFMQSLRFTGLLDLEDVAHALSRYDRAAHWPVGGDVSFTRHFAPAAWDAGWTLASQAEDIWNVVRQVRKDAHLAPNADWPMKTFAGMVKYLLVDVAGADPRLRRFETAHIETALKACGYLALEQVRQQLTVGEAGS
jgi:hypothetical protein